jgi:hypothetical protein
MEDYGTSTFLYRRWHMKRSETRYGVDVDDVLSLTPSFISHFYHSNVDSDLLCLSNMLLELVSVRGVTMSC